MAVQEDANPWSEVKAKAKGNKRKNEKKRKHNDRDNSGCTEFNANTNPAISETYCKFNFEAILLTESYVFY